MDPTHSSRVIWWIKIGKYLRIYQYSTTNWKCSKHSKIFWVGWPFDLIGNLHLKKNNAPFFFIHNNLIPRTLMAACEKVPNLISFFVCAKLRLKILPGLQCPRNRKIVYKMSVKVVARLSITSEVKINFYGIISLELKLENNPNMCGFQPPRQTIF